ncbi:MAG: O-antigen ligase family protein [Marinobacter sp.]|uniref:O-antigen ligase family protein n=1 Tax=Marinobacter sp. TaxID=50741 RepID=UPI001B028FF2|nr:O-antigen ligase family protein [Marinobacter sp.]
MSAFFRVPSWVLPLWLIFSFCSIFSLLMWQQSTGAGLNIFDTLISLPTLLILAPLMIRRGMIGRGFLLPSAPLLLYLLFTLVSMAWAIAPDYSKTFRAAGQVLAIFILFSYLRFSGNTPLLKRALMLACISTAVIGAWHLVVVYGLLQMPWETTLYDGGRIAEMERYGVKPINSMLATLLVAPQAAMLLGLIIDEDHKGFRALGLVALAVLLLFLVALERRTGQVSILVAIIACIILYRNRFWYTVFGLAVIVSATVLIVVPEFILSRGLSWRPAIWLSTLDSIAHSPFLGHGITNRVTPVTVFNDEVGVVEHFRHPHNMALSIAYFLGIAGLSLWFLIWVPGLLRKLQQRAESQREGYIVITLLVGVAALMFDGGDPLSPFHFDWFCFWVPAMLLLSSQAVTGQQLGDGRDISLVARLFPPFKNEQV